MNGCCERWQEVPFGTIAEFKNGINYNKENFGKGIKVINVKDFQDYSFASFDNLDEINPDRVVKTGNLLKKGDILFVRSNGNRELIGRSLFIKQISEQITHSAFTIRARFISKDVEPLFYAYLFRSPIIRSIISAQGNGTNISNLNQHILNNLVLPLPPIEEQRRIMGILSSYDDLIENNTRRIKILEEMAQMIYREWFVNFRFPGHEKVKMVKSSLGMIPEGWEVKDIGNVVEINGGGTPSTNIAEYWEKGDITWFSPTDLTASKSMFITGSAKKITSLGIKKSSARLFPAYSLMMTSRATIGVIAINTEPACTNQGFITCIPNDKVSVYQLYFWVNDNKEKIISLASGATFKEINKTTFRALPIIIASEKVNHEFVKNITSIGQLIQTLLSKNQNLKETRDLLLPKLISGQIDVGGFNCESNI